MKNRHFNFLILLTVFAIVAIAPGCGLKSSSSDDDGSGDLLGGKTNQGLTRCENCDDVLSWVRFVAKIDMDRQLEMNFESTRNGGYWGDDDWTDDWGGDDDFAADDDASDDAVADDDQAGDDGAPDNEGGDDDQDFSDTNNQEEGVDEADIVKTDGELLFLLSGGNLMIFDPLPADLTHELSRMDIEGRTLEMFIYGHLVVVFSQTWSTNLPVEVWPGVPRTELAGDILIATVIDAADPASPQVVRKIYAEGSYVSSRRIANKARIVVSTWPIGPYYETWVDPAPYYDENGNLDEEGLRQAYEELKQQNDEIIDAVPLENWVPRYFEIAGADTHEGFLIECQNYFHPASPMGRTTSSIVTIDLDNPLAKQPDVGLLADGQLIYSSVESLYITAAADTMYAWNGPEVQKSMIHKFALYPDAPVDYVGSGEVTGFVLNQFSMSEYLGYLRVATTEGWWGDSLKNYVYVLAQGGGVLNVVGQISNIAPGEQIRSARFMKTKGYLVTFEQTDPLFTIDVSDPTSPQIVGELEIPGFSTYIHPFDDNHILTIGQDGDEWGATGGVVLQLFDISDFAHPALAYKEVVAEGWDATSEALYDHKAFLYYAPLDLLAVPVMDYNYDWWDGWTDEDDWTDDDEPVPDDDTTIPVDDDVTDDDGADDDASTPTSGVYVYEITAEDGFRALGVIDHSNYHGEDGGTYIDLPTVHRCVVIGDYLYSISDAALVVTAIEGVEDVQQADLPFTYEDWWGGGWTDDDWDGGGEEPPGPAEG